MDEVPDILPPAVEESEPPAAPELHVPEPQAEEQASQVSSVPLGVV